MRDLPTQIKSPEQAAVLKVLSGTYKGKQFRLIGTKISIGRSAECDIILKDNNSCSREHAIITYQNKQYTISSLNPKNPVIVNKKQISQHTLNNKDLISIGQIEFLFASQAALPSVKSSDYENLQKDAQLLKQNKNKNVVRVVFGLVILFVIGFVMLEDQKKQENNYQKLKTSQDIFEEAKAMEEFNNKEITKKALTPQEEAARIAFIKGFRDYRKGYYLRALKAFEHCTTIHKKHSLCTSYTQKSKTQIERLIQRKIVLGKSYKKNKQFDACEATFKSVEIMIQDSSSPVFKEVVENRKYCNSQLKNKI